jgi:hypothetical protein
MNTLSSFRKSAAAIALIATALCVTSAHAAGESSVKFISGGASVEDFAALNEHASGYSLKLMFAAKGSGAYLADVEVSVMALPSREVLLETRTEGPMLLAALPAGRYQVTAKYADVMPGAASTVSRTLVVPRTGLVSQIMYFSTADVVGADSPREYQTGR